VQAAEADVLAAGLFPNPTLSYSRECCGSPDTVEQSWMLEPDLRRFRRRGLHREAASRRVAAVTAGNASRQLLMAAEIRRSFHEVLFRQETIRATETWAQRFARVEGMVGKLARAGEASGYDRRRLERERQTADARLAAERAELERVLARLAALTGAPDDLGPKRRVAAAGPAPLETVLPASTSAPTCRVCRAAPRRPIWRAAPRNAAEFRR
jgi:outer membrane protein, heavy metal efflux system